MLQLKVDLYSLLQLPGWRSKEPTPFSLVEFWARSDGASRFSVGYFLNIHMTFQEDVSIAITQKRYAEDVVWRFNMSEANRVSTPIELFVELVSFSIVKQRSYSNPFNGISVIHAYIPKAYSLPLVGSEVLFANIVHFFVKCTSACFRWMYGACAIRPYLEQATHSN